MELFDNLIMGFTVALSPATLLACAIGVTLGTAIGVLPGIGPIVGISLLLPLTYDMPPTDAIVMLAGIYYGGLYGGSTAAILLNLPGTPSSAATCLEGYPMAKAGRAGVALLLTTIASFVGGTFSMIIMMAFSAPLTSLALAFGSAEYFSMMVLGLVAAGALSNGSAVKGIAMVVLGLLLGLVGSDVETGRFRFTFGFIELADGISLVVIAMGLFGVAEILQNFASGATKPTMKASDITFRSLLPTRDDMRRSWPAMGRGSVLGGAIGFLPGAGATIAAFMSYALEKKVSKEPERFGKGAVEGLTSVEAANNSAAQAAFIPTMTLGIPGNAVMALLMGALMIHGITPGPSVISDEPGLFWGLIASFWIGNLLLVVLNAPLVAVWVRLLTVPYKVLFPVILFLICIGVYSINNSPFDIFLVLLLGGVGFLMRLVDLPPASLMLGFVLGPLLEQHLRRALLLSRGDGTVFLTQPISGMFLLAAIAVLIWSFRGRTRKA